MNTRCCFSDPPICFASTTVEINDEPDFFQVLQSFKYTIQTIFPHQYSIKVQQSSDYCCANVPVFGLKLPTIIIIIINIVSHAGEIGSKTTNPLDDVKIFIRHKCVFLFFYLISYNVKTLHILKLFISLR